VTFELVLAVKQLRANLTVALAGPVVNAVGSTGQVLQGLVAAIDSGDPGRVLNVLATAPVLVTDRVLNGGYVLPGGPIGSRAWPGVLTQSGDFPGPMSAVVNVGQFFRAAVTPQPDTLTSISPPGGVQGAGRDIRRQRRPEAFRHRKEGPRGRRRNPGR
jgi:hypothetical protein